MTCDEHILSWNRRTVHGQSQERRRSISRQSSQDSTMTNPYIGIPKDTQNTPITDPIPTERPPQSTRTHSSIPVYQNPQTTPPIHDTTAARDSCTLTTTAKTIFPSAWLGGAESLGAAQKRAWNIRDPGIKHKSLSLSTRYCWTSYVGNAPSAVAVCLTFSAMW